MQISKAYIWPGLCVKSQISIFSNSQTFMLDILARFLFESKHFLGSSNLYASFLTFIIFTYFSKSVNATQIMFEDSQIWLVVFLIFVAQHCNIGEMLSEAVYVFHVFL